MSFPDIRIALDFEADLLFKRQIVETPVGEAITVDSTGLDATARRAAQALGDEECRAAMVKHMREHSYKSAKNAAKSRGRKILKRLNQGQWPLKGTVDDAVYALPTGALYPLRHMTYAAYFEDIDVKHRQAKHDMDEATSAKSTADQLVDRWGNRMLGEVCDELSEDDDSA